MFKIIIINFILLSLTACVTLGEGPTNNTDDIIVNVTTLAEVNDEYGKATSSFLLTSEDQTTQLWFNWTNELILPPVNADIMLVYRTTNRPMLQTNVYQTVLLIKGNVVVKKYHEVSQI